MVPALSAVGEPCLVEFAGLIVTLNVYPYTGGKSAAKLAAHTGGTDGLPQCLQPLGPLGFIKWIA